MKQIPIKRGTSALKRARLDRVGSRARSEASKLATFRREVLARAGGRCDRCRAQRTLEAHHLLPRSRGGKHEKSNGAALCLTCHDGAHCHIIPDWTDWIR